MKSIGEYSDQELLTVIRKAVNTNIPGSEYQRANQEWQMRQQQKILEATKNSSSGKVHISRPLWKRPEIIFSFLCFVVAVISIPWWSSWFGASSNNTSIVNTPPVSRGADFLSVNLNPETKSFSVTNDSDSPASLSIYDVSFHVGDITIDKYGHEFLPNTIGPKTTFSTLGFGTTTQNLQPHQQKSFDLSTFPFVTFEPWTGNDPDLDLYCFFLSAKNSEGQESFYPVITSRVEFMSGFDNPQPQNSAQGGGYEAALAGQNIENEIETECEDLYQSVN